MVQTLINEERKVKMNEEGKVKMNEEGKVKMNEEGRVKMNEEGKVKMNEAGKVKMNEEGKVKMNEEGKVKMNEEGKVKMNEVFHYLLYCWKGSYPEEWRGLSLAKVKVKVEDDSSLPIIVFHLSPSQIEILPFSENEDSTFFVCSISAPSSFFHLNFSSSFFHLNLPFV